MLGCAQIHIGILGLDTVQTGRTRVETIHFTLYLSSRLN